MLTNVSHILTRSERDMGLSYAKNVSLSFAVWAQCRNVTDRQTNRDLETVTSIAVGEIACQQCRLLLIINMVLTQWCWKVFERYSSCW